MEGEFLKTMDIDPFHPSRLTFLSSHYVLFLEDFNVSKAPISDGNPLYLRNFEMPKRCSSISKNSRIRRFVQDIVTMTDGNDDEWDTECIAIHFHRFLPQHLFLVFPREIFLLDLDFGDAFYVLQDNGIVTLRVRKNLDYSSEEVIYDTRASGELLRLQKGAKLIGMSVNVNTEHSCAIVTTDGRVFLSQLQDYSDDRTTSKGMLKALVDPSFSKAPLRNLKLNTLGVYTGLTSPPLIIRMCPALTSKNWPEYRPIMAGASAVQGSGTIQIYDLANGVVEKEFAVHTFPVRGMEWTGMNTILSYAFQNLSGESSMHSVRNELVHTDVRTGQTHQIRTHRSNESPIDLLRVSHLKQYFLLTFKNAPIELWDLNKMTHLTTMSKKFPPISALEWSPIHNLKSIKRKNGL
ncbi:unnamed protein product [Lepeophtheirus salmonis]|uniref:(salmon louse) hypothetical protein n=1 Tax=Lepeophtheirus salmonis TaxID=72036 RepID=A0A7R8D4M9_LEPSM|nr:unnamed protein product [Lepeophtheirus salmonis]CAF3026852.1 unnamed protein product [Lepeophtheirus salmonis]